LSISLAKQVIACWQSQAFSDRVALLFRANQSDTLCKNKALSMPIFLQFDFLSLFAVAAVACIWNSLFQSPFSFTIQEGLGPTTFGLDGHHATGR
jgi:hypothetical protein